MWHICVQVEPQKGVHTDIFKGCNLTGTQHWAKIMTQYMEFAMITITRLKGYHYMPISHDLFTLSNRSVLITFLMVICIHGKSSWKFREVVHPLESLSRE